MAELKLNTSGFVRSHDPLPMARVFHWADLDPFAQGYIEAAWPEIVERIDDQLMAAYIADGGEDSFKGPPLGFSDLAPETLARIMADCAAIRADRRAGYNPEHGGDPFWHERQRGALNEVEPKFPPLTPYLGDDGKVYLREDA